MIVLHVCERAGREEDLNERRWGLMEKGEMRGETKGMDLLFTATWAQGVTSDGDALPRHLRKSVLDGGHLRCWI